MSKALITFRDFLGSQFQEMTLDSMGLGAAVSSCVLQRCRDWLLPLASFLLNPEQMLHRETEELLTVTTHG